jgi:hypothetical protein
MIEGAPTVVMRFDLRSLTRGWRAALLLAAVALCSPGTASAACGDYITYADSHRSGHAMPMADADGDAAPAKSPCDGRDCSGKHREFPPAPSAPGTSPPKEQARPFAPSDSAADGSGARFTRDFDSPRPVRRATSIFHPPRLG